jgi:hypothetical protein
MKGAGRKAQGARELIKTKAQGSGRRAQGNGL